MNGKLKLLVLGSVTSYVSGTSVSLQILLDLIRTRNDVEITYLNTSCSEHKHIGKITFLLKFFFQYLFCLVSCNVVSIHINEPNKAIPLSIFAKIFRKPLIIRWFGGVDYKRHGNFVRRLCSKIILRIADVNLKQTQWLTNQAKNDGSKVTIWYSTSRIADNLPKTNTGTGSGECRKFLYAGQIKRSKGVFEIIEASLRFNENVLVDFYGDFKDEFDSEIFNGLANVRYCGKIKHNEMVGTMRKYDALLLPSYHPGEGYPGVIVEAYLAGIPVIASNFQSIPEIVDPECGILVEAKSVDDLYIAMQTLVNNKVLYQKLSLGAYLKGKHFQAQIWSDYFIDICKHLFAGKIDNLKRKMLHSVKTL